jgi:hypothetical protein
MAASRLCRARELLAAAAILALTSGAPALAADPWKAEIVEKPKALEELFKETRLPAPSEIPGMLTAPASAIGDITAAWYSQPTSRYRHGALGDTIEGGALVAQTKDGLKATFKLPETEVFEDIAPRLADLDGDGISEIVTVLSSFSGGASVTIFGFSGGTLMRKAAIPFLGTPNEWINIAGIERYLGMETPEIAVVVTPHKRGQLGFLKLVRGRLIVVTAQAGFSNHVFGSSETRLSASADIDGNGAAELALPSLDRKKLTIMSLTRQGLKQLASLDLPAPIDKAIGIEGEGPELAFIVGLEDGSVWRVSR